MNGNDLSNYQRYLHNLKHRGFDVNPLPIPPNEPSLDELIAEGDRLLEEEAKANLQKKKTKSSSKSKSKNPYHQAREKILSDMDPEKRKHILRLEKENKKDSYQYEDFLKEIQKLGDQLSNE